MHIIGRGKSDFHEVAKKDTSQTMLSADGIIKKTKPVKTTILTSVPLDKKVFCPFCLKFDNLQKFLVSTKKGISQSRGICPYCESGMFLKTLLTAWTPELFARWVFNYSHSGFWSKIKEGIGFTAFNNALRNMNWSYTFWGTYKSLKGDNDFSSGMSAEEKADYDAMLANTVGN